MEGSSDEPAVSSTIQVRLSEPQRGVRNKPRPQGLGMAPKQDMSPEGATGILARWFACHQFLFVLSALRALIGAVPRRVEKRNLYGTDTRPGEPPFLAVDEFQG